MKKFREWMLQDLAELQEKRNTIKQLEGKIKALEEDSTSLKSMHFDHAPSATGGNYLRDKIEQNIADREVMQLKLNALKSHVAVIDNLLSELDSVEKTIIDDIYIKHNKTYQKIAEETLYDVRSIPRIREGAIEKLLQLRFGAGYKP